MAPSRGACFDPSRVGAGGRRGGARLYDAHPGRPSVRDQGYDLRHGRIAPGFLRERRSWKDHIPAEEDEAGTSGGSGGSETGTWRTVDDDGRFASLVDLFLCHGGSLETVEELIQGVKARADQEMENWCPDRIRIRASTDVSEPNIFLDVRKEAEKWEHIEELRLWMKHTVGLLSDIVNNGLGPAYFVSVFRALILIGHLVLCSNYPIAGSQDLKETSHIKLSFIHATRGGWEQLPILKDKLLESQEKLLKAYKELLALEEEKKEREAALAEAREASKKTVEEATLLRERTTMLEETASKARDEASSYKNAAADLDKEKGLLKTELASARETFQRMKVECVNGEIGRSAADEAKKKALEDLEAERTRSCGFSDDVNRLKGELLEKNGAIAQAGKVIEDLRVANTELVRSNKEIQRANTNLVGVNTALEESIRGTFLLSSFFSEVCFTLSNFSVLVLAGLKDELLAAQVEARSTKGQLEGEVALNGRLQTTISDLSASWELEPVDEWRQEARGDALVDQLCFLGAMLRDRVQDALHVGVKRAMAVVCSGFFLRHGGGVPRLRHRHLQD